jgi:hypothetical protein
MEFRAQLRITLVAIVLGAAALGCKSATPIKTLLDDPSRFDHQRVRIRGEVKESIGVLGYGGYRVDDGTGVITVVTQSGGAPRTGAQVGVEGEFRSAFTVGSESVAVVMESRRYSP